MKHVNSFDFDGVIYLDGSKTLVKPHRDDVIITGRPYEERQFVFDILSDYDILNDVYFNCVPRDSPEYTRENSALHKVNIIKTLFSQHIKTVDIHFEDDPIQAEIIKKALPNLIVIELKRPEGILNY